VAVVMVFCAAWCSVFTTVFRAVTGFQGDLPIWGAESLLVLPFTISFLFGMLTGLMYANDVLHLSAEAHALLVLPLNRRLVMLAEVLWVLPSVLLVQMIVALPPALSYVVAGGRLSSVAICLLKPAIDNAHFQADSPAEVQGPGLGCASVIVVMVLLDGVALMDLILLHLGASGSALEALIWLMTGCVMFRVLVPLFVRNAAAALKPRERFWRSAVSCVAGLVGRG
jgi:hypothetical protein